MKRYIIIVALFLSMQNGYSQTTFTADINDGRNVVKFESKAPLETIIGLTNRIGVKLLIDPNDISRNPKGTAIVDLGSLKTGIELRDKDMKSESFLNIEKFPSAEFVLTSFTKLSSTNLVIAGKITATANGKLTIHGVTKDISVPISFTYFKESEDTKPRGKGNLLVANTTFQIKMTDYGLKIPTLLFYRLKDEIELSVSFIATDAEKMATAVPSKDRSGISK